MIPHYDAAALAALPITAQDIIAMLQDLIRGAAAGTVQAAPKVALTPADGRYIMATLAAMDSPPLVVTKSLVLNAENSARGLAQINGLVTVLDGQTGLPLATLDNNWLTGVRTAGLSALAAHSLARPDASSIGFVGTGLQARAHLALFRQMFPLTRIKISGRGRANIDALIAAADGLEAEVVDTPQAALQDVDLAVTSVTHTAVTAPFLDTNVLAPGAFVSVVDLAVPWHKESFGTLDRVIIDDLQQEAQLPNKLADPAHVHGDLSGLVSGAAKPRQSPQERTAFVFRGHALGDLALAALAWDRLK
jgi:ornithine cyclodeaminase/alanine dehydrogenase